MRTRELIVGLALLVALAFTPGHVAAQGFSQVGFVTFTTDVVITTTTEKDVVYSGPVTVPRQTANVCIMAWAQVTTAASTTTITPRIRRGTGIAGTLVGEANPENVKAAAGSTEFVYELACEDRADVATVDYSFTVQTAAAGANGAALQGGIVVFVR